MNFVSFTKYKSYLESLGYSLERGKDDYSDSLHFITYFFSKEGEKDKYFVNVFTDCNGIGDHIMSINYGHGSIFVGGIKTIKIDMRKKFWKNLV